MTLRLRNITIFALLALVAFGATAMTGFWHPNAPNEAMRAYLPAITLPAVIAAGAIDGINPCAFTVLLLFITAMTSSMGSGDTSARAIRGRLLGMGGIYIAAVFLTYLALGLGLLKSLDFLPASTYRRAPAPSSPSCLACGC